jgi:hypothetical protein
MRSKTLALVGAVSVWACSSSSTNPPSDASSPSPETSADSGGDSGSVVPACATTTPQTNTSAGSCTYFNIPSEDAGEDAGPPALYCLQYTGSGQQLASTTLACKTMVGTFSASPCSVANPGATVIGYCLRNCGDPTETTVYYYTGAVVAEHQCQALNFVWVPVP